MIRPAFVVYVHNCVHEMQIFTDDLQIFFAFVCTCDFGYLINYQLFELKMSKKGLIIAMV